MGVIDIIVDEPVGGAHRDPTAAIESVGDVIANALDDLSELKPNEIRQARRDKFIKLGSTLVESRVRGILECGRILVNHFETPGADCFGNEE